MIFYFESNKEVDWWEWKICCLWTFLRLLILQGQPGFCYRACVRKFGERSWKPRQLAKPRSERSQRPRTVRCGDQIRISPGQRENIVTDNPKYFNEGIFVWIKSFLGKMLIWLDSFSRFYRQVSEGLTFLHNDVKLLHHNICPHSIVLNKNGAWKIAGFDFCIRNANTTDQAVSVGTRKRCQQAHFWGVVMTFVSPGDSKNEGRCDLESFSFFTRHLSIQCCVQLTIDWRRKEACFHGEKLFQTIMHLKNWWTRIHRNIASCTKTQMAPCKSVISVTAGAFGTALVHTDRLCCFCSHTTLLLSGTWTFLLACSRIWITWHRSTRWAKPATLPVICIHSGCSSMPCSITENRCLNATVSWTRTSEI